MCHLSFHHSIQKSIVYYKMADTCCQAIWRFGSVHCRAAYSPVLREPAGSAGGNTPLQTPHLNFPPEVPLLSLSLSSSRGSSPGELSLRRLPEEGPNTGQACRGGVALVRGFGRRGRQTGLVRTSGFQYRANSSQSVPISRGTGRLGTTPAGKSAFSQHLYSDLGQWVMSYVGVDTGHRNGGVAEWSGHVGMN